MLGQAHKWVLLLIFSALPAAAWQAVTKPTHREQGLFSMPSFPWYSIDRVWGLEIGSFTKLSVYELSKGIAMVLEVLEK